MAVLPQEKTIPLSDSSVSYVTFGSGPGTLVLVPGLSLRSIHGTAMALGHMYRIFAKDYTVYVIDRKNEINDGITIADLAADLAETMCRLNIKQADVIGISQGGMIAQYLALDHPELVRKLVLGVTLSRVNETTEAVVRNWLALMDQGGFEAVVKDMMGRMYSAAYVSKYERFFPLLLKVVQLDDAERFKRLAASILTMDVYERLEEIHCPVFVIGGEQDRIATPEASYEIEEQLHCPIYMYQEYGHSAYEEAKDFNERIFAFLKG